MYIYALHRYISKIQKNIITYVFMFKYNYTAVISIKIVLLTSCSTGILIRLICLFADIRGKVIGNVPNIRIKNLEYSWN